MRGSHFLKGWSRTQQCVTLSSAEAELVAMNKTAAEVLGCMSMYADLGLEMKGLLYGDSSAALAISNRKGCGKLRHINVGQLWLQEKVEQKALAIAKVRGEDNPADLMTKYLTEAKIWPLSDRLSSYRRSGRADAGLRVQVGNTQSQNTRIV